MAEPDELGLNAFYLDGYDVPYGYTPLLLARPETIQNDAGLSDFLDAIARGYQFAGNNPQKAAEILYEEATGMDKDYPDFLAESQQRIADAYLTDNGEWRTMDYRRWQSFVDWLSDNEILTIIDGEAIPATELDTGELYTNTLLEVDQ